MKWRIKCSSEVTEWRDSSNRWPKRAKMSFAFLITSKLNGNVIDVLGGSTAPGTPLDAYPPNSPDGSPDQLWNLVPDPNGSGYYFIQSVLNGFVIDIRGASSTPGTSLDAYPMKTAGTQNQLWNLVPDPSGSGYVFIQSLLGGNNGNVIDILGGSTEAGARLDAYPMKSANSDNQLWKFSVVVANVPNPPVTITAYQFPNNENEGTLGAPFEGLEFVLESNQTAPSQSYVGLGVYLVSVPSGTVLTLSQNWEADGFAIVDPSGGGVTSQLITSTYTSPATIYVQAANVL
jgi:hypothetical protein